MQSRYRPESSDRRLEQKTEQLNNIFKVVFMIGGGLSTLALIAGLLLESFYDPKF